MISRVILTHLKKLTPPPCQLTEVKCLHTSSCDYAARKYIRLKRMLENRKRARARALEKASQPPTKWVPPHLKIKLDPSNLKVGGRREEEESLLPLPSDDVFFTEGKKHIRYSLEEIITFFRDSHDATMLDEPDSLLVAHVDLDLRTAKRTKFASPFSGTIANVPHKFGYSSRRSIVAICKDKEEADRARVAGAEYAGCQDIIKDLNKGNIKREMYDEVLVSTDMLVAIAGLRGILKDNFPTKSRGNYGPDVAVLVTRCKNGIFYQMKRDDFDPAFGFLNLTFARLNLDLKQIEENLDVALARIQSHKPPTSPHPFIHRVFIECTSDFPDAIEKYCLKHWLQPSLAADYSDPDAEEPTEEAQQQV